MTEDIYLMWLGSLSNISVLARVRLYEYFKNAENVWKADKSELLKVPYINEKSAAKILSSKNERKINEILEYMQKYKVKYVNINDLLYPQSLKEISDYPLGFYMYGEMPPFSMKRVAVIGTRKADRYGLSAAKKLSGELSENNVAVVSGMALGIDAYAHAGAIEGGGKTIAVLGCGIDIVYPAENRELERMICRNGCVMTEFAPKTPPLRYNFPVRNRIVSGMSDAVAVIQAPKKSGSLITANLASEYGKTVFALPGNIENPKNEGTNMLIRDGAQPLLSFEDILFDIGVKYVKKAEKSIPKKFESPFEEKHENEDVENKQEDSSVNKACPDEYADVYECISDEPISVDDIFLKTDIPIHKINSTLLMLEYGGYIEKMSANRYVRAR